LIRSVTFPPALIAHSRRLVGRTLGGYAIRKLLGRGGMGAVYQAWDRAFARDVALKVAVAEPAARPGAREWLEHEARWLHHCDDPHVVPIYAVGRDGALAYIAMELMAYTLQDRIGEPSLTVAELVEIGAGLLLGLAAAHRVGIVHRDVKPANVGVTADGTIKLLDFGVANPLPWSEHIVHARTERSYVTLIGSIQYMPPEQLRGAPVDQRADIYSAGAVLYELATGVRPFRQTAAACLIDAILNQPPVRPSALNPAIPSDLDRLLLRALAKPPAARFPSVLAMMDALLAVPASRSVQPPYRPLPNGCRMAAPCGRRRDNTGDRKDGLALPRHRRPRHRRHGGGLPR
jgi:serine/threonine protein kinase